MPHERIDISFPETPDYTQTMRVRVNDVGGAGHLAFDKTVSMINDAAAGFLAGYGVRRGRDIEAGFIFADLAVSYRAEAHYGDHIRVEAALVDGTEKGITLHFRLSNAGTGAPIAMARIGAVCFNYRLKKPAPIRAFFPRVADAVKQGRPP